MAEYQEVLKQWNRMCNAFGEDCDKCPIEGSPCRYISFGILHLSSNEQPIMKWAAEHPEPVYPTWREWLIQLGIVSFDVDFHSILDARPTTLTNTVKAYINEEGSKPIPADTAQKLGLQPKEGV